MSHENIIRAWKDEEYRNSLSEEQRSQLPENPAGMIELSDEDMQAIAGGNFWKKTKGIGCWLVGATTVIAVSIATSGIVCTLGAAGAAAGAASAK